MVLFAILFLGINVEGYNMVGQKYGLGQAATVSTGGNAQMGDGGSGGGGMEGVWKRRWAVTHAEEEKVVHKGLSDDPVKLLKQCQDGAYKSNQKVFGVPLLNYLGQYISMDRPAGWFDLMHCLVDAGLGALEPCPMRFFFLIQRFAFIPKNRDGRYICRGGYLRRCPA
jgi:hypothetical protein